jgi:hypothetical protein
MYPPALRYDGVEFVCTPVRTQKFLVQSVHAWSFSAGNFERGLNESPRLYSLAEWHQEFVKIIRWELFEHVRRNNGKLLEQWIQCRKLWTNWERASHFSVCARPVDWMKPMIVSAPRPYPVSPGDENFLSHASFPILKNSIVRGIFVWSTGCNLNGRLISAS